MGVRLHTLGGQGLALPRFDLGQQAAAALGEGHDNDNNNEAHGRRTSRSVFPRP